eukprot:6351119-Pyramimonas_sp.AAC.1
MGVDRLSTVDLDRRHLTALDELAVILDARVVSQCWPHQLLLTIGALLPRKVAGDRVIGSLPHISRMRPKAREPRAQTWPESCEAPWGA